MPMFRLSTDTNPARREFRVPPSPGIAPAFIGQVVSSRADHLLDDPVSRRPLVVVEGNRTPGEVGGCDPDPVNQAADDRVDFRIRNEGPGGTRHHMFRCLMDMKSGMSRRDPFPVP